MKKEILNCLTGEAVILDFTTEETTAYNVENDKFKIIKVAETEAKTAKATAQVSGNTKLLALGLTQAEATALTGYTPE
jgi:hypothetical protein